MHELGITRNIVSIVSERAHGAKVTDVTVEIGKLSAIMPDAVRFCFDVVSQGTSLEGATLHIREIPGQASCHTCGITFPLEALYHSCPCGSRDITRLSGEELNIKDMVII
jgi:hydrogenase nickel incorporation protein HypA/HybF